MLQPALFHTLVSRFIVRCGGGEGVYRSVYSESAFSRWTVVVRLSVCSSLRRPKGSLRLGS